MANRLSAALRPLFLITRLQSFPIQAQVCQQHATLSRNTAYRLSILSVQLPLFPFVIVGKITSCVTP